MANQEVAKVTTPVTAQAMADALASAWSSIVPEPVSAQAIRILLAQSAYETAQWSACHNWNFGNVHYVDGDGFDYYWSGDHDGNGNPITVRFRSYPSLYDGAAAFLKILHGRFHTAWPYVMAGDPYNFITELRREVYFVGSLEDYRNGVIGYFKKYQSIIPRGVQNALQGVDPALGAAGLFAVGLGIGIAAKWLLDEHERK